MMHPTSRHYQADQRRFAHAFTLIELLVVIAVIALLIGILLPSLGNARETAKTVKCQANLRNLVLSAANYSLNNKGYFGTGVWDNDTEEAWGPPDTHGWVADLVNGEYTLPGLMLCPSNPARYATTLGELNNGSVYRSFPVWERDELIKRGFNTNYVQTWYYAQTDMKRHDSTFAGWNSWKNKNYTRGPLQEKWLSIASPSKVPLLADATHQALDTSDRILINGENLPTSKVCTDGPTTAYNVPGLGRAVGTQNYTDMGPAHGKGGQYYNVDEEMDTTRMDGDIGFADGNVQLFKDTGRRDGKWGSSAASQGSMQYNQPDDLPANKVYIGWLTRQGALNF